MGLMLCVVYQQVSGMGDDTEAMGSGFHGVASQRSRLISINTELLVQPVLEVGQLLQHVLHTFFNS